MTVDRHDDRLGQFKRCETGRHVKCQGGRVLGLDRHARTAFDRGDDAGALPMPGERVDRQPMHAVIFERVGRQRDRARQAIPSSDREFVHAAFDFKARLRMIGVRRLGADDVRQLDSFAFERLGHQVGGLLLFVDLAAVGDSRALKQVGRDLGAIIPMPEFLFIPSRFDIFILEDM